MVAPLLHNALPWSSTPGNGRSSTNTALTHLPACQAYFIHQARPKNFTNERLSHLAFSCNKTNVQYGSVFTHTLRICRKHSVPWKSQTASPKSRPASRIQIKASDRGHVLITFIQLQILTWPHCNFFCSRKH